jgi:hypothetical protein
MVKKPNKEITFRLKNLEEMFGLPQVEVQAEIESLGKEEIIRVEHVISGDIVAFIPANALVYLQQQDELEKEERKKQRSERGYDLKVIVIAALITAILGYFVGIMNSNYTYHLENKQVPKRSPTINPTLNHKNTQTTSPTIHKK